MSAPPTEASLPPEIVAGLRRDGLIGAVEELRAERLTGGVSSDIWKVTAGERVFCVKRAMAKLAVKDEWLAPVERNRFERLWYETANARVPGTAPKILASDDGAMFFAMEFLDPARFRLWKGELLAGRVDLECAASVGSRLARIHATTAGDAAIAAMFPTGVFFEALRLDPYLRATARRHPEVADELNALANRTAATKRALVHGDVSPKNIMIAVASASGGRPAGDAGPVFLDAECAWYGDPAFDVAFCLNHLLLKCLARPAASAEFLIAFDELRDAYLGGVDWEPRAGLEARAASLLPGLFLARVDGKSPVEYVTGETDRERVRRVAVPLIRKPADTLSAVRDAWAGELGL